MKHKNTSSSSLIQADWQAPKHIRAFVTGKNNNKENLLNDFPVQWLEQVHGSEVYQLSSYKVASTPQADAIYTRLPEIVCGINTADCLPAFFTDIKGTEIAIAHAGWRGLAAGILENTVKCFQAPADQILVWFGPAIGPCHFEVGEEVREIFLDAASEHNKPDTASAFLPGKKTGKWMANLYELARIRLQHAGLKTIDYQIRCTYCDSENFHSYRRDKDTGRISSLICLTR